MKYAIGYLRVSTKEQGRSGLGLAAQRTDIERFAEREGFSVKSWHQDIQTGAGADALLLRPGLAAALKEARAARYALIVSRLDRLSRNVHFITGLMEHKVHFVVAALGRDCDEFTLHIYASLAEQERKMISERCKAAIAVQKRKGRRFGVQRHSKSWQRKISAMGRAVLVKAANERAEAFRPYIEWALRQPGRHGMAISFDAAATRLNERGIPSPLGGRWRGQPLGRMAGRIGINHPPPRLSLEAARDRVREIWKKYPEITAVKLVAMPGFKHVLGIQRAWQLVREIRREAAKRSPIHKRVGWFLDRRTAARIRVSAIWKRHPDFTAKQVVESLGPEHAMRLKWVQRVMNQCWRASARHSPKQVYKGRRFYAPWRAQHDRATRSRGVRQGLQ